MNIRRITLELLRPGPPHGQLLSPLTQYIALCEEHGPITLSVQLEHFELLRKLGQLRYTDGGTSETREQALRELGLVVQRILADLVTVPAELGRAAGHESDLVHLRLVLTGSELALLPFELGVAPLGYPGEGLALLAQRRVPVVVTREARRGRAGPAHWNRPPRVLFVSAAPQGTSVPFHGHLKALREQLQPWVSHASTSEAQEAAMAERLTVIERATLASVRKACRDGQYTHVHVLAHGAPVGDAWEQRYGVMLFQRATGDTGEVVDGQRLAQALLPRLGRRAAVYGAASHGTAQRPPGQGDDGQRPSVVTLATCDSGNVGTAVAPGASIAHELQGFGIPVVFASQFPLTKPGSIRLTDALYAGLLAGEDPRVLLYNVRETLRVEGGDDHDWAALVAYTALPEGFEQDVEWFRAGQARRAIDVQIGRAAVLRDTDDGQAQAAQALGEARALLERWRQEVERAAFAEPSPAAEGAGAGAAGASRRHALLVQAYSVSGATAKRIAELEHEAGDDDEAEAALREAMNWYGQALTTDPTAHWPLTQYLSLLAVLREAREPAMLDSAVRWATRQLDAPERIDRAWAHATLAELRLLAIHHHGIGPGEGRDEVTDAVEDHCRAITTLLGADAFQVGSTRRQFLRYLRWWRSRRWRDVALRAVETLDGE